MKLFGILKFVTGILIALALLFIGGAAAGRYLITRLTAPPAKPIFAEEQVSQPSDTATVAGSSETPAASSSEGQDSASEPLQVFTEPVAPEPELSPDESATSQANARIIQPIGMVLRQGPNQGSTQIGSLYYNDEVIVLGTSADGEWQQVQLPGSGVEGWIKAGNTEALN
jgi:hypothetical protein